MILLDLPVLVMELEKSGTTLNTYQF